MQIWDVLNDRGLKFVCTHQSDKWSWRIQPFAFTVCVCDRSEHQSIRAGRQSGQIKQNRKATHSSTDLIVKSSAAADGADTLAVLPAVGAAAVSGVPDTATATGLFVAILHMVTSSVNSPFVFRDLSILCGW